MGTKEKRTHRMRVPNANNFYNKKIPVHLRNVSGLRRSGVDYFFVRSSAEGL